MVLNLGRVGTNGGGHRKLTSWIDSFLAYTEDFECAPIWCQWAAISTVAAALERRVWATTTKGDLFPNMYTVIVGPAGKGKSLAIMEGRKLLQELVDPGTSGLHLAPTSMTMASLADELAEAKRVVIRPGLTPPTVEFNALAIFISEFSSFMHEYDKELMGGLTDIWDGWPYSQRRRGNNLKINIICPQLNILAGSTASNLIDFMPERAWDQGFASRMIMVYSGGTTGNPVDIFSDAGVPAAKKAAWELLAHDLKLIGDLFGKMTFEPAAVEAFRAWRNSGETPVPNHPKLTDYCARRTAHLIKLCIVASASRGSTRSISEDDFDRAKHWLLGAETTMPDIFSAGIGGGDSRAMDEAWHFIFISNVKRKGPVPEHELIHFVRERVPSHAVMRVVEIMVADGTIKPKMDNKGMRYFEPGPRKPEF